MRVWIDQELCTGDGLCEETCPSLFELHDDALAYVKEIGQVALCDEQGRPIHQGVNGKVAVPTELEKAVRAAVEECPGECIFIET
jgi:ferredoxin